MRENLVNFSGRNYLDAFACVNDVSEKNSRKTKLRLSLYHFNFIDIVINAIPFYIRVGQ